MVFVLGPLLHRCVEGCTVVLQSQGHVLSYGCTAIPRLVPRLYDCTPIPRKRCRAALLQCTAIPRLYGCTVARLHCNSTVAVPRKDVCTSARRHCNFLEERPSTVKQLAPQRQGTKIGVMASGLAPNRSVNSLAFSFVPSLCAETAGARSMLCMLCDCNRRCGHIIM